MFRKILIANRGEIAVRVIRACRELGIETVAVYSDIDRDSLHVSEADSAICIGPATPAKSYLNIPNIIAAAELSGADAIHPGYGFLSENAKFSDICQTCGITFIGPPHEVINRLGDKVAARKIMQAAGVPVIPGTKGAVEKEREALNFAATAGYPVIIKAAGGGGGRGMRICFTDSELRQGFGAAQNEAQAFFKNPQIYVEKYILKPRHIEFQILADTFGNVIHVGDRDCSIQRRHQKLVEEAPSTFVSDRTRNAMGRVAVKATKAAGYVGAGTIEFLVDQDEKFYFIEANTRVQVEHSITEVCSGIDIIKEQIRIAEGERLSVTQKDVELRGHAIEFRINAENPLDNFKATGGTIDFFVAPGGPGVRVDTHIYSGYKVPTQYDSLLAKLIVWGRDREEAIARGKRALDELIIDGMPTSIPFHEWLLRDEDFLSGKADTGFVEANYFPRGEE
jgi:acetyl-CoA carboxylase biotin carboxylase subunit